jgi:hypothetical protein
VSQRRKLEFQSQTRFERWLVVPDNHRSLAVKCGTGTGQNCMTLHDAFGRRNLHFLSFSANSGESRKQAFFPCILPMKTGVWLGPESNRRHVDFQSTALPTELPSLCKLSIPRANHGACRRSLKQKTPNAQCLFLAELLALKFLLAPSGARLVVCRVGNQP